MCDLLETLTSVFSQHMFVVVVFLVSNSTLFCCEAPEMFCGLWNFIWLSISVVGGDNDWIFNFPHRPTLRRIKSMLELFLLKSWGRERNRLSSEKLEKPQLLHFTSLTETKCDLLPPSAGEGPSQAPHTAPWTLLPLKVKRHINERRLWMILIGPFHHKLLFSDYSRHSNDLWIPWIIIIMLSSV